MDVHVRDLRYFVAVAEELSFTRAAVNRLFISQPALSKQIRLLESSLRAVLFDRDRRTVRLTEAGEALLPRARQIIADWDKAQRVVTTVAAARSRTLTVGFQTRIGRGLIPAVTATMGVRLPDWRLQFRQVGWSDPTAGLAAGEVDVAIAWLPVPDTGELSWRVVATEERWVAVPPGHRLAGWESVPCAELLSEPFIAPPSGPLRDFWLGNDHRPTPATVVAEAETAEEMLEAVAAGVGVALLSEGNARIDRREDVVTRPVTGLSPGRLAVIWRTEDRREAVRVFTDSCVRCLCDGPEAA